jgi:hypothetical protein
MRRRDLLTGPAIVALAAAAGLLVLRANPLGVLRPCPLRALSGVPCPTCGATAASRALLACDVAGAFRANPLFAAGIVLAIAGAVVSLAALPWARRVRAPSFLGRRAFAIVILILFLANWLYLILSTR